VRGRANYSHWYNKISKGHITVMCCENTGFPMTGKVKIPQMLIGDNKSHSSMYKNRKQHEWIWSFEN
jgi:hypothetical protein